MIPLFAAFTRRRYTLLWFGQLASHLGTHIYEIALAWWVLQKTGSAAAMGGVLIAAFAPSAIFVLLGGVVADRLPRIPIMLASDCGRFALIAIMAALAFSGSLTLWLVLVLSALFGILDAFFWPAYKSIFPELVPRSELASANSLEVIGSTAVHILAPAVGAGLIAAGGTPIAFALNGVSFLISAVSLIAIMALPMTKRELLEAPAMAGLPKPPRAQPGVAPERPDAPMGRFWREIREGVAATRALTWVWLTITLAGVATLTAEGAIAVALPYYVQHTLAASPLLYGGLLIAAAVGGAPAALWFGSRTIHRRGLLLYITFAVAMLATAAVGLSRSPALMIVAMFLEGLCLTVFSLAWTTALQQYIPLEKLGRVTSFDQLGSNVMIPLSYALTGLVVDRFGAQPDLVWGGLIAAAVVSLGFFSRSVRALD